MTKAIITGVGGFLGFSIAKKLLNDGVIVYGISTSEEKIESLKQYKNFIPIIANFSQYNQLYNYINDKDVDVLIHCAWQGTTSKEYQDFNIQKNNILIIPDITNLLLEVNCKKVIYIGSAYQHKILKYNSNEYVDNFYGIFKSDFEKLMKLECIKNNISFYSVTFTTLFGVGDTTQRLVNSLIKKAENSEIPTLIDGNNLYDFLYIDDAVEGILSVYKKGVNLKSYYIGQRNLKPFKNYILDIFHTINPSLELTFGGYDDKSYIDYSKINLDELYNDTGFECKCDFKESILKTAEWLNNNQ